MNIPTNQAPNPCSRPRRMWTRTLVLGALLGFGAIVMAPALAATRALPVPVLKPPPPSATSNKTQAQSTSQLLTPQDRERAKSAFKWLEKSKWKESRKFIRQIKDPLVKDLLDWHYIRQRGTPAGFEDVTRMLNARPDWPSRQQLLRHAEETMPAKWTPEQVLAFIADTGGPASTMGQVRNSEALLKSGFDEAATLALQAIWVTGNFTKSQEKAFYRRHKKRLTKESHLQRLDRLIWAGRTWPAKRQYWRVSKDQRKLAIARIWLMKREGNVDTAIKEVPSELKNDDRLIYERLRWRRRKGRLDGCIELLDQLHVLAPHFIAHPEKWWIERAYLARLALQKGRIEDAYKIVSRHGLPPASAAEFSEAEWMAGWIQLSFLGDPKKAYGHFQNMLNVVRYPVSVARGAYWSARASEQAGDSAAAAKWYGQAAQHLTTYYGQLAAQNLNEDKQTQPQPLTQAPVISTDIRIKLNAHPLTQAVLALHELGEQKRMRPFILALADMYSEDGWKRAVSRLARNIGRVDLSLSIAKKEHRQGALLTDAAYPEVNLPKPRNGAKIETPLVLAMIRQESAFYPGAKSHANARGLMQIMPATAKKVARSVNLSYSRDRLIDDPSYNMVIGQNYMASLIRNYKGSYVLALSAYNAGPGRASRWMRQNGDPRKADVDIVNWVEMIPIRETRDYVQRVIGNLKVYRRQMGDASHALQIETAFRKP